jgi:membrane protein implicated in regulation of membrane protease activity
MNTKPLQSSPNSSRDPDSRNHTIGYRMVWACLPFMLALSGATLFLLGISWWTLLVVVLLLSCPAAMAIAIYYAQISEPPTHSSIQDITSRSRDHRLRRIVDGTAGRTR